ncbi:hypothetical protein GCM10020254_39910 [Streptomyces goshikiensis]
MLGAERGQYRRRGGDLDGGGGGVIGSRGLASYSTRPVAVSMTEALRRLPSAGSANSGRSAPARASEPEPVPSPVPVPGCRPACSPSGFPACFFGLEGRREAGKHPRGAGCGLREPSGAVIYATHPAPGGGPVPLGLTLAGVPGPVTETVAADRTRPATADAAMSCQVLTKGTSDQPLSRSRICVRDT